MGQSIMGILPFVAMIAVMWFFLIRPAQKRQRETKSMQTGLKRGDNVITIGGIHGTIDAVDDATVYLKVADGITLRFDRQAVGRVSDSSKTL